MSNVPSNPSAAKFSTAERYAYMHAVLGTEKTELFAKTDKEALRRIKKINDIMRKVEDAAEDNLGVKFDDYIDAHEAISPTVATFAKNKPEEFKALLAAAEKTDFTAFNPLLSKHFSGNLMAGATTAIKPEQKILYEQMGLDASGKPVTPPEVPAAELAAVNNSAKITDEAALEAAREAEKAQNTAAHAGEVSRVAKIEAESLAKGMAQHSKAALREATHALARLTQIDILQKRAQTTVDVMKAEGTENANMLDVMRTQTIAQLEFQKQTVIEQIRNSTPEVKNAYAFLSKKFPVEKMASTVFAQHGAQYEKLLKMGEHSGMVALISGLISMALFSIHPKQKPQLPNADGTMPPPETNKMGLCLKVAGVACAVLGVGMAFGGKQVFDHVAASSLLSELKKAGTAVKV